MSDSYPRRACDWDESNTWRLCKECQRQFRAAVPQELCALCGANDYRAGLEEGFRRGVKASAQVVEIYEPVEEDKTWNTLVVIASRIRALRPEGEKT